MALLFVQQGGLAWRQFTTGATFGYAGTLTLLAYISPGRLRLCVNCEHCHDHKYRNNCA
jgi:hypothetical protein